MHHSASHQRRSRALAPAAVLLLALCLLATGAQALVDPATTAALVVPGPGLYELDHDLAPSGGIGVLVNGSDVVFDGMGHRIAGTGANGSVGVLVTGRSTAAEGEMSTNVTVRNVTVSGWDDGVRLAEVSNTAVEGVVAEENGAGLAVHASTGTASDHLVRDSVFRENAVVGISLGYAAQGIAIERCSITGNGKGVDADLFRSSDRTRNQLVDSTISDNTENGISFKESGFLIRDCTIGENGVDGIYVEHGGAEVVGCHVEKNGRHGISSSDRGGSDIHGNWITGNAIGVTAGGDWASSVRNNYLNNTENGYFGAAEAGMLNYTKTAGENIVGGPYLGGNFWASPNGTGFSQTHPDTNGDGFCDVPYVVNPEEGVTDYLPLALANGTPTPPGGSPYRPLSVPGRIQAEDYNLGGQHVAYYDTTPGNTGGAYRADDVDIETAGGITNVGWIRDGEYLTYTVNVSRTGLYLVSLRVATPNSGRTVEVSADGGRPITYRLPNTGSFTTYATATLGSTPCPNTWMTVTQTPTPMATGIENQRIPISLSDGTHVIKLAFHGDGQNLDWFEVAPDGTAPPPGGPAGQPYPASHLVPGRVESEDFDTGGFSDTSPANEGGAYRTSEAVDIERGGSNYNVGWVRPGEYLEYSVDTYSENNYLIGFRVANPGPAKTVTVRINGGAPKNLAIPATGSFATWQTATLFAGWLHGGRNTVRVETGTAGAFNLDYMQFTVGETQPPTPPAGGGASFVAVPTTAPHGSAVKFTVTPASGKSVSAAWWSFDAPAHLNSWNSRTVNPTFYYPSVGTFSPLVKITYTDGSTETVQRANYVKAT